MPADDIGFTICVKDLRYLSLRSLVCKAVKDNISKAQQKR